MNDTKALLAEHDDIKFMIEKYSEFIDELRAEQLLIKQLLENIGTWKSGHGKDAYHAMLEEYFREFSLKIAHLEDVRADIKSADANLKVLIHSEINKGPKW